MESLSYNWGLKTQFYQRSLDDETPEKWREIGVNKGFAGVR
jgi:hypothetical protein